MFPISYNMTVHGPWLRQLLANNVFFCLKRRHADKIRIALVMWFVNVTVRVLTAGSNEAVKCDGSCSSWRAITLRNWTVRRCGLPARQRQSTLIKVLLHIHHASHYYELSSRPCMWKAAWWIAYSPSVRPSVRPSVPCLPVAIVNAIENPN